jgi:hypothetical protein
MKPLATGWMCVALGTWFPGPASAANLNSYVASNGDDAAGCSRATPCQTFQGALAKTDPGGQITCLDAADYGAVIITQSASIVCDDVGANIRAPDSPTGTTVTIQAGAADTVYLSGLILQGERNGAYGIRINSAGSVVIRHCTIGGFNAGYAGGIGQGYGIVDVASTPTKLEILDTMAFDNGGGVFIIPTASSGTSRISLSRVQAVGNYYFGITASSESSQAPVEVSIADSLASQTPSGAGIEVQVSNGGGPITADITRSTIVHNNSGLIVAGADASVHIGSSSIMDNGGGLSNFGATLVSYGDNQISKNSSDVSPTYSPLK